MINNVVRHIVVIGFELFLRVYQLMFLKQNVIQKYRVKFDGVEFYLVKNFYEMAELLIEGRIMPWIFAASFMYILAGNISGYTIKLGSCKFVYIRKEFLDSSFGTSVIAHEVGHIINRHSYKIFCGKYDGLNFDNLGGEVVVYDFEAQADAYALKMCGDEEMFYSDKNFKEFEKKNREAIIRGIEEYEDMFGEDADLSSCKNDYIDEEKYEDIFSSLTHQMEIRKNLLPKYL